MANDFYGSAPDGGMYGGYNQPYNTPGATFQHPGMSTYTARNYGGYQNYLGRQNNAASNTVGIPVAGGQQSERSSNAAWIYVPNLEAAKNVSIMPNQTLYIMNQNKNEFYLKTSNEMGVSLLKVCPFSVFEVEDYEKKSQMEQAQTVAGGFVGREEFNNFVQNVANQFAILQNGNQETTFNQQQPIQPIAQSDAIITPSVPAAPANDMATDGTATANSGVKKKGK